MAVTYGTSALPSPVVTVTQQSTTAVSLAFDQSVGIVGGYDTSNGSLSSSKENSNIEIEGIQEAKDRFGKNSELHLQTQLAFANGAGRVIVTPVGESQTTESFASSQNFTLSQTPIDPRFNTEHTIDIQDTVDATSVSVNYVDGTPSTPTSSNTANVNPQTGEVATDGSSDYDVTYTVGDYSTAVTEASKADVRFSAVCSANESVLTSHLSAVNNRAEALDFKRAVGAVPTAVNPSNYTVPFDDQRIVLTAPTYGTGLDQKVFLTVPIAAQMASEPLGGGATGNGLNGITSVSQDFTVQETVDFGSNSNVVDQVTVARDGLEGLEIVEDLTTSTGPKFRDVYRCEIIDDITYSVHLAAKTFIDTNSPNTPEVRELRLEAPIRTVLRGAANNSPPLLSSTDGSQPFTVSSSAGANDETVNLEVGIDVTGLTKTVDISIGVGAVNTFEGAE